MLFQCIKTGNKQLVSNQCPVSLLPICYKIFEKYIFGCIYDFLDQNCLLNVNQSGFRPGDSCIHQLKTITYNVFTAFDVNPSFEARDIFLDLSKVIDRVWQKGRIPQGTQVSFFHNFIRPSENAIFNTHDQVCIKLLNRLRLGFSHLRENKFRHNFKGTFDPLSSCSIRAETLLYYLRCQFFHNFRKILIDHCVKSVQIRSYFWSVFSLIRTEYEESEYRKIRTKNNSVFGHFSRSG